MYKIKKVKQKETLLDYKKPMVIINIQNNHHVYIVFAGGAYSIFVQDNYLLIKYDLFIGYNSNLLRNNQGITV